MRPKNILESMVLIYSHGKRYNQLTVVALFLRGGISAILKTPIKALGASCKSVTKFGSH